MKAADQFPKQSNELGSVAQTPVAPVPREANDNLDSARHDRTFNPIDQAARGLAGAALNEDSGRYRKGPGPV